MNFLFGDFSYCSTRIVHDFQCFFKIFQFYLQMKSRIKYFVLELIDCFTYSIDAIYQRHQDNWWKCQQIFPRNWRHFKIFKQIKLNENQCWTTDKRFKCSNPILYVLRNLKKSLNCIAICFFCRTKISIIICINMVFSHCWNAHFP